MSELSARRMTGGNAGSVAVKLSNETICGCLCVTSLPCRCFGVGGGFFLPLFTSDANLMLSSSSDSGVSTDVCGDSLCASCGCSKIDCRDTDEVSVLLLLSNGVPPALVGCAGGPEGRGVGLPVKSRFLKLSTSRDALLFAGEGLCVLVRSLATPSVSCDSSDASVFANGFGGTLSGDGAAWGPPYSNDLELGSVLDIAMASLPTTCAFASRAVIELLAKPAGVTGGGGLERGAWVDRLAMSSFSVTSSSPKSGCGGMVVVGEAMRTDFFVFGGGEAASSSTVRQLLLHCQQTRKGKAREYHSRSPSCEPWAR